eukprot:SM000307S11690  [mRNA]  locus=s307:96851:98911:- [translate_table: standard]
MPAQHRRRAVLELRPRGGPWCSAEELQAAGAAWSGPLRARRLQAAAYYRLRPAAGRRRASSVRQSHGKRAPGRSPGSLTVPARDGQPGVVVSATAGSDQSASSNGGSEQTTPLKPDPEIGPAQVVQAQLEALRRRDLSTVFEFASPANKAHTGPLSSFSTMLESRAYNMMLEHAEARILSTVSIGPTRFQQRVSFVGAGGIETIFVWSLSKQEEGSYKDCWMTDMVRRDDL